MQGNTVSANRQCCAASGKPCNPFGQGGPMLDQCLQGLPVCSRHNGISNGDKFCKAVRFQQTNSVAPPQASPATHLAKKALCGTSAYKGCSGHNGNPVGGDSSGLVLLIILSLRGTDLEVGVLWYGVALWAEGRQISLLCKATAMLKVTLTRFCSCSFLSKAWACNIDA